MFCYPHTDFLLNFLFVSCVKIKILFYKWINHGKVCNKETIIHKIFNKKNGLLRFHGDKLHQLQIHVVTVLGKQILD